MSSVNERNASEGLGKVAVWAAALFPFYVTTGLFILWAMGVETPQITFSSGGGQTEIVWGQVKGPSDFAAMEVSEIWTAVE